MFRRGDLVIERSEKESRDSFSEKLIASIFTSGSRFIPAMVLLRDAAITYSFSMSKDTDRSAFWESAFVSLLLYLLRSSILTDSNELRCSSCYFSSSSFVVLGSL